MAILILLLVILTGCTTVQLSQPETSTVERLDPNKCFPPLLIDRSGYGFDDTLGRSTVDNAISRCHTRYHGCLVRLTRVTELSFRAVCKRSE
jgi:hypothetical protein